MKIKLIFSIVLIFIISLFNLAAASATTNSPHKFEAKDGNFLLDGKPYLIKAAELHYPRIPKEYWDQRIKMSKALGMNTICMYIFWNIHEPQEGEFDFTEQNDIREFIELCQANGMNVIMRPGPYVCAEWEMGGLPWWLLKNKDVRLRDNDDYFLEKVETFQSKVAEQVGDMTVQNGGPVLMIQVENEYGAYGENREYVARIRDILRQNYGEEILLFQCDWSSNFKLNGLDDLLWTLNFGTGADIDSQFSELKSLRPDSPLMCSEYWSGWFDKWGANHETRPADEMVNGIAEMFDKGISFSLYMTHGGTNWGHWAGANSPGYSPDVTSYDYDAPISESGQPTEKFRLLREALAKYADGNQLPELPELIQPVAIQNFELNEVAPLFMNLNNPIEDENPSNMEAYGMGFGSILYSKEVKNIQEGTVLQINEPHDYAQIFVDRVLIGTLDRRKDEKELILPEIKDGQLDILVEATGRINFGREIKDFKGITDNVALINESGDKNILKDWKVYLFPDENSFYAGLKYYPVEQFSQSNNGRMPIGVYRGEFNVDNVSDTFLNFESWGKGLVYVNGKGIGRIWDIGPQQTLYVPGPWLKEGKNEIMVVDIIGPERAEIEGLTEPIYDKLKLPHEPQNIDAKDFSKSILAVEAEFAPGNGWKEISFPTATQSRYIALEIINTHNADELPAIAELYILDENGNRISRENWKVITDGENSLNGNHTSSKIIDLQESTFWEPEEGSNGHHFVIIDMGEENVASGIQYLPRMETGAPGSIKSFRIYVSKASF